MSDSDKKAIERLHVLVRGRVQGVGFRYSACDMARELGLRGWVRNTPEGNVEAEFQGTRGDLEKALAWCRVGPRVAHVMGVEVNWLEEGAAFDGFAIRR